MSLPEAFINQTRELLGTEAEALFKALGEPASISVRMNLNKPGQNGREGLSPYLADKVPWSSFGRYLKERPAFTFDPLMHAGCYYVQEASSMFVEKAMEKALEGLDSGPVRMLDLCAAPGGKSTLAISCLPEGSLLVANELIRTRANILGENLIKWGNPDVVVTQSDPSAFSGLTDFFDLLLTDVPCSGEGMFRKDPVAVSEWSLDNVRLCASRQREILTHCWPALRSGGFLIYSTCTFNRMENEDNVRWICEELGAHVVEIPLEADWNITGPAEGGQPVYHFYPHKTKGEGFFLALLQKKEGSVPAMKSFANKQSGKSKKAQVVPESVKTMLKDSQRFDFYFDRTERICALRKNHLPALRLLEEKLRIVHAGVAMGEVKGKDLLPDISLGLSTELDRASVKTFDLDLKQSIAYLRREAMILPETCPLGWVLMLHQNTPLGWMKNIGNRANNAYPAEWRIRSENPY